LDIEGVITKVFRSNAELARSLVKLISNYTEKLVQDLGSPIKIMNFCGTHEWTTTYYGLRSLMPEGIELVAGPGCPVCITPGVYVDELVRLSLEGIRVYTFGDAYRLPTTTGKTPKNLAEAQALGGNVKVVYSFLEAVKDAKEYGRDSVFFGIGFETTAPSYALLIKSGEVPENLKLLSALRLTPPVMRYVIKLFRERGLMPIRGVIAPGHVSAIIGGMAWEFLPKEFKIPTVVTGFEPIDVLVAVARILKMLVDGRPGVSIEYSRLVRWEGNLTAKKVIDEVFEVVNAAWRGIGYVPKSGLELRDGYSRYDAVKEFKLRVPKPTDYVLTTATSNPYERELPPGCRCGEVVLGIEKPTKCPLFMKVCKPESPLGPCMVSSEGTCRIWALYGGVELVREV
jgi:hydrogenase expression/formation protein HypD